MSGDDDIDELGRSPTTLKDPVIGTEVSGYRVTGRLGSGGMGVVYEGEQPLIGKRVAIKVLRHEIAEDPEVVQRLVAEARAVNQVGHRGIIDVFGVGHLPDGRRCIVMELLDGEPLENVLRAHHRQSRAMPLVDALVILEEIFSALAAAHVAGVIHRDLKPSNIFLCKQRDGTQFVKLLDFGIAKLGVLGPTPSTRASMMVGTPGFMAPEQAEGGPVGPAMDLYAAGVVAFELLTGRQPFEAANIMELLMRHASTPAPRMSTLNPTVPPALDELVARLLAKKPSERPATADAVRTELLRVHAEVTGNSRQETLVVEQGPLPRSTELEAESFVAPKPSRRPQLVIAALGLPLIGALIVALLPDPGAKVHEPQSAAPQLAETKPDPSDQTPTPDAKTPPPTLDAKGTAVATASPTLAKAETGAAPSAKGAPATTPARSGKNAAPPALVAKSSPPVSASASSLPLEVAQRIERIEKNLIKAEASGDDVSGIRRELTRVRERLKTASPADAERLQFRLMDLELETTP